jgi:hypothetical protein
MSKKPKFKVGDKVRIVNYGSAMWLRKKLKETAFRLIRKDITRGYIYDHQPEIVGKEGIIAQVTMTQGIPSYAIDGIRQKYAWYHEGQLELVKEK